MSNGKINLIIFESEDIIKQQKNETFDRIHT